MNVLVIGAGFQWYTLYSHLLHYFKQNVVAVIDNYKVLKDLPSKKNIVYLSYDQKNKLELQKVIFNLIQEKNISFAIICSSEEFHGFYIEICIRAGIDVLVDKPPALTMKSYTAILTLQKQSHHRIFKKRKCIVSVFMQRRYQSCTKEILKIANTYAKNNIFPTDISLISNDGQHRFPHELIKCDYHGFSKGLGKLSHTGYHLIDIISLILKGSNLLQLINSIEFIAFKTNVNDIIHRTNNTIGYSFPLDKKYNSFGEVDISLFIKLKKDAATLSTIILKLMHSGFTSRTQYITYNPRYNNGRISDECIRLYYGDKALMEHEKKLMPINTKYRTRSLYLVNYIIHYKYNSQGKLYIYKKQTHDKIFKNKGDYFIKKSKILCFQDFINASSKNIYTKTKSGQ